jgi:hypothetical protein
MEGCHSSIFIEAGGCDPIVIVLMMRCGAAGVSKVERCQAVFTRHVVAALLHIQQYTLLQRKAFLLN